MIDLAGKVFILIVIILIVRLVQIYYTPYFTINNDNITLFQRKSSERIHHLISVGSDILITGTSGVGKTIVVKEAIKESKYIKGLKDKILAPLYIDLRPFIKVEEHTNHVEKTSADKVLLAIKNEVDKFEGSLLRIVHSDCKQWITAFLSKYLFKMLMFSNFESPSSFSTLRAKKSNSVDDLLQHIVDSTETYNKLLASDTGDASTITSVIVIDEIHLLNHPALKTLRDDLLTFSWRHLSSKPKNVILILISSEINIRSIISTWNGGKTSFESLLSSELIGDLSYSEAREYMKHLVNVETSSGAGITRLNQRINNDTEFSNIYKRYGGYIPDLQRLARSQLDNPLEDSQVSDRSNVQILTTKLDTQLSSLKIDPKHIMGLFKAIVNDGISPRGAVSLSELVDNAGIPEAEIYRMGSLGLIEVRETNPEVLDYAELKSTNGEAYVCAPSPLARESMLKVVKRLVQRRTSKTTTKSKGGSSGRPQTMQQHNVDIEG